MPDRILIRLLETPADHFRLQAAQEAIWGPGAFVVADQTLSACKFGGIALGAFHEDDMAGFCYGWPAYKDGEVWLHSHLLGVLPAYRNQGLGARLKQAQGEAALRLGYRRMTWTYDPLEAPNARLNIAKLGGTVREYLVDCYGPLTDTLNRGLPTDRFLVDLDLLELNLVAPRGREKPRPDGPLINPGGGEPDLSLTAPAVRLAIPPDFRPAFAAGDHEFVLAWRLRIRTACLHYFARGYAVTGFAGDCYILEREDATV
ncbi:MAG TPA: GNAT family N-acetyltransferase [Symbiobacteriaceae bacterium]|jgi:predicted GNAT superfamily acetyltransferase